MSYRKVARSYRRSAARAYGGFEQRPRARLAAVAGLMVIVLGVGMAILIASHSGTSLGTSGNAADLASNCTTPTATASAATDSDGHGRRHGSAHDTGRRRPARQQRRAAAPAAAAPATAGARGGRRGDGQPRRRRRPAAALATPRAARRRPPPRRRAATATPSATATATRDRHRNRHCGHAHVHRIGHAVPVCHAIGHADHSDDGRECQLRHHRAGQAADRAGPGHAVPAHRDGRRLAGRLWLQYGQRGEPRRLRAGDHPGSGHRETIGV